MNNSTTLVLTPEQKFIEQYKEQLEVQREIFLGNLLWKYGEVASGKANRILQKKLAENRGPSLGEATPWVLYSLLEENAPLQGDFLQLAARWEALYLLVIMIDDSMDHGELIDPGLLLSLIGEVATLANSLNRLDLERFEDALSRTIRAQVDDGGRGGYHPNKNAFIRSFCLVVAAHCHDQEAAKSVLLSFTTENLFRLLQYGDDLADFSKDFHEKKESSLLFRESGIFEQQNSDAALLMLWREGQLLAVVREATSALEQVIYGLDAGGGCGRDSATMLFLLEWVEGLHELHTFLKGHREHCELFHIEELKRKMLIVSPST